MSFFNLEHNVVLYVHYTTLNEFIFEEIKLLNLVNSDVFRHIDIPEYDHDFEPVFFKSYVDGRKVFLDKQITSKMKACGVVARDFAFEQVNVQDGYYSLFLTNDSNLVVDFHCYQGDFYITDILKPDFMKFGLYVYQN